MQTPLLQALYHGLFTSYQPLNTVRVAGTDGTRSPRSSNPPSIADGQANQIQEEVRANKPNPTPTSSTYPYRWLGASLAIALIYSILALSQALSSDYVVQDDARQHVFWMARFLDPTAFPNDLIADYFQSVAPAGYQFVYRVAAWVGLSPILFHKLLPVSLNLLTAGLCFRVGLRLFPLPAAAFTSSVLLGQGLGLTDAIVSGTPKAFIYPLFLLFMNGILGQSKWLTWISIVLEGLFYPQLVLISAGILCLRLLDWTHLKRCLPFVLPFDKKQAKSSEILPPLAKGRVGVGWLAKGRDRIICLGGLLVAGLVLLPYAVQTSIFGPILSLEEARQLPELAMAGSRSRFFFDNDPTIYWLNGRSGLRLATVFTPVTNLLGLFLLGLPWWSQSSLPKSIFPSFSQSLSPSLSPKYRPIQISLLPQIIVSSLGCFFLAHLLLFRLHLPSRYTQHSLRIVASLAAGIVLVSLLHGLWNWTGSQEQSAFSILKKIGVGAIALALSVTVLGYPLFVGQFPLTGYQYGRYDKLYGFLKEQPPSTVIASLSNEVNNLPTFTQRSILSGSEYAIPYHVGYYQKLRQRTVDLIEAQYSNRKKTLKRFIKDYGITLWLLDKGAFKPKYLQDNLWIQQHPKAALGAFANVQGKKNLPLLKAMASCQLISDKNLVLLDAQCVTDRF
ncbi:MAG: hypothetical protein AAGD25_24635 [Cyanobacteria bacterium P01_F01_bin.150]